MADPLPATDGADAPHSSAPGAPVEAGSPRPDAGWQGRTLAENVAHFVTEEHWDEGEANLFDPANPDSFAHFLSKTPGHEAEWQSLQKFYEFAESPMWAGVPGMVTRAVTAALAWLALGPRPGQLVLRSRRLDASGLAALLNNGDDYYHYSLVRALLSEPCMDLIKPIDPEAAGVLERLAAVGGEALRRAVEHGWVDAEDIGGQARVLRLSLEPEENMRARAGRMRAAYAANPDAELNRLLNDPQAGPWADVIVVVTGEDPTRFGYITKAQHARQRLAELQALGGRLRAAVFWLRMRFILFAGGPVTARWPIFIVFWLVLVGVGVGVVRDVATTTWLVAGLAGLRLFLGWRLKSLARHLDPEAKPWSWRDAPDRCLDEARRVWQETPVPSLMVLTRELAQNKKDIASLPLEGGPPRQRMAPLLLEFWMLVTAGSALCLAGFVQFLLRHSTRGELPPPAQTQTVLASAVAAPVEKIPEPAAPELPDLPGLGPEMAERVARGEYEIVKEGFGHTLRGPLKKWDLPAPASPLVLRVESQATASPAQRAMAMLCGELLLRPYASKAVTALLAVRVPSDGGVALMLFNAREKELVDDGIFILHEAPEARAWYRLGTRNVVYLGVPEEIAGQNSLALH